MTVTQNADSTQVAAGQLFPEDWNNEFAVIRFIVQQMVAELETATPVQVVAVHPGSGSPPAAGTVDVQLLVSIIDGNGNATQQGQVFGIPFFRLQGGPWAVIIDPAVNDFGFIVAASRDISNVVKNPGQVIPGSFRKFSFSDGVYIPMPYAQAAPQATFWGKSDGTFVLTTKDGVVIKSDGSGNLVGSGTSFNWTGNIAVTGNITATGEITRGQGGADQVTLGQHIHSANNTPPTPGH